MITALTNCLINFYKISEIEFSKKDRPTFVLQVETEELEINAGLMDRVVQIYEHCVFMNFEDMNNPKYEPLHIDVIQQLNRLTCFLVYLNHDRDSGKMHNDVKQRYLNGEENVREAMKIFGEIAFKGKSIVSDFSVEKEIELVVLSPVTFLSSFGYISYLING